MVSVQKISCVTRQKLDNFPSQAGQYKQSCSSLWRVWYGHNHPTNLNTSSRVVSHSNWEAIRFDLHTAAINEQASPRLASRN